MEQWRCVQLYKIALSFNKDYTICNVNDEVKILIYKTQIVEEKKLSLRVFISNNAHIQNPIFYLRNEGKLQATEHAENIEEK